MCPSTYDKLISRLELMTRGSVLTAMCLGQRSRIQDKQTVTCDICLRPMAFDLKLRRHVLWPWTTIMDLYTLMTNDPEPTTCSLREHQWPWN